VTDNRRDWSTLRMPGNGLGLRSGM